MNKMLSTTKSLVVLVFFETFAFFLAGLPVKGDEVIATNRSSVAETEIHEEILRTVTLLSVDEMSEEDVNLAVDELKSFSEGRFEELLFQLLLVYGGRDEFKVDPKSEMAKRLLIAKVSESIPGDVLVSYLAPHLEQGVDPSLQKNVCRVLELVAFRKEGRPEFSDFISCIKDRKSEPPESLILFMYRIDPKAAGVAVALAYEGEVSAKEFEGSLRVEDSQALELMSTSGVWWKELYVSIKMQKSRHLESVDILNRLEISKSSLVRQTVREGKEAAARRSSAVLRE